MPITKPLSADDINALRRTVSGVRTTWKTVTMVDVITGDPIRIASADDMWHLEYWTIDGESGVTLPESRKKHLRDSLTEEAIGPRDGLWHVLWIDADSFDHEAYLTPSSLAALHRALDTEADAFGSDWSRGEVQSTRHFAEPGSKKDAISATMKAFAGR